MERVGLVVLRSGHFGPLWQQRQPEVRAGRALGYKRLGAQRGTGNVRPAQLCV